jgi:hypothetical protein
MKSFSFLNHFDSTRHASFLTPWSLIHGASGILSRSILSNLKQNTLKNKNEFLYLMHALYECKDLYYSYFKQKNLNPNLPKNEIQNSLLNSIGDQLVFTIGVYLSEKFEISLKNAMFIQIVCFLCLASPLFQDTLLLHQNQINNNQDNQDNQDKSSYQWKQKWNFDIWYRRG